MELYFSPLACSMATRIALYEAGADAAFKYVDLKEKRLEDGSDYRAINPLGQVPVLRLEGDELLSENAAVLQYVGERYPAAGLVPTGELERARSRQWLSFLGTELHKGVFTALVDPRSSEGAREYSRSKAPARFARLEAHLSNRAFLLERFGVADAYLATLLNWCQITGLSLEEYPALRSYHARMLERPSVARALAEERPLYEQQWARWRQAS